MLLSLLSTSAFCGNDVCRCDICYFEPEPHWDGYFKLLCFVGYKCISKPKSVCLAGWSYRRPLEIPDPLPVAAAVSLPWVFARASPFQCRKTCLHTGFHFSPVPNRDHPSRAPQRPRRLHQLCFSSLAASSVWFERILRGSLCSTSSKGSKRWRGRGKRDQSEYWWKSVPETGPACSVQYCQANRPKA